MSQFELTVLDWFQTNLRCAVLDIVMPFVSALGDSGFIWVVFIILLLCTKRYRRLGMGCAAALVLNVLLCNILLKPLVGRIRPFDLNPAAPALLVAPPTDFSFPSGHVAASFATTGALYAGGNRLWIPAAALSVLMGLSRMYLYVHYPSDVLAGLVLGTVAGVAGQKLFFWLEGKYAARRQA